MTISYTHTDLQGNVIAVTDQNQTVIERRQYEPYGLPQTPINDDTGYTGHLHDGDTGLVYMQQRYYDPQIGQFLSVDPVGVGSGGDNFNRYWYANNNPSRFVDPDGMLADPVPPDYTQMVLDDVWNSTKKTVEPVVNGGRRAAGAARAVGECTASFQCRQTAMAIGSISTTTAAMIPGPHSTPSAVSAFVLTIVSSIDKGVMALKGQYDWTGMDTLGTVAGLKLISATARSASLGGSTIREIDAAEVVATVATDSITLTQQSSDPSEQGSGTNKSMPDTRRIKVDRVNGRLESRRLKEKYD